MRRGGAKQKGVGWTDTLCRSAVTPAHLETSWCFQKRFQEVSFGNTGKSGRWGNDSFPHFRLIFGKITNLLKNRCFHPVFVFRKGVNTADTLSHDQARSSFLRLPEVRFSDFKKFPLETRKGRYNQSRPFSISHTLRYETSRRGEWTILHTCEEYRHQ